MHFVCFLVVVPKNKSRISAVSVYLWGAPGSPAEPSHLFVVMLKSSSNCRLLFIWSKKVEMILECFPQFHCDSSQSKQEPLQIKGTDQRDALA